MRKTYVNLYICRVDIYFLEVMKKLEILKSDQIVQNDITF